MGLETPDSVQWLPQQMSRLAALAHELGIEPELVTDLIRLRASRTACEGFWPIRVYTLGRFEIVNDGRPLRFAGKIQRRPLALLKALVTMGGSDVPEDRVIDMVWGQSLRGNEGNALHVTLHRLRKLLGHDKALQVAERRISVNRRIVWVDLWALEQELEAVIPVGHARVPGAAQLEQAARAILDLYRGQFLDGEPESAWLMPVRNRVCGRFARFVMGLGDHWEASHEWRRACDLYERAVELDPLAEVFYCRLMVCLAAQGRRTEAIDVFRRYRQLLSVTLGGKPAAATEAVYRRVQIAESHALRSVLQICNP